MRVADPRTSRLVPISERAASSCAAVAPGGDLAEQDVALGLGQHAIAFGVEIEVVRPAVAPIISRVTSPLAPA